MTDETDQAAAAPAVEALPAPAAEGRARRERKQPEVFKPEVKAKEEFVIKPGHGTKLGDIPNVKFKISKHKPDDEIIIDLHKALYGRPGVATKRKRDIQEFSGFVWEGDEEREKAKVSERVGKLTQAILTSMCDILDLSKDGKKEEKAGRIVEFLLAPKATSDKDLAAAEAKKKEAKKRQREKTKAKTPATKPKGKKKAKKAGSDDGEDDDEAEDEEEQEEDEEGEEEEEAPKKEDKPRKEETSKPKQPRKVAAKGKAKAEPAETEEAADNDEGNEEETVANSPTDDELRDAVRIIVSDVDAASYTLKSLLAELTSRFPAVDFSNARKKKMVKGWLIEFLEPAAAKDEGTTEGGEQADTAAAAEADDAKAMEVEPAAEPVEESMVPAAEPEAAATEASVAVAPSAE